MRVQFRQVLAPLQEATCIVFACLTVITDVAGISYSTVVFIVYRYGFDDIFCQKS